MFKNLFKQPRYLIENLEEGSTHYRNSLNDAIKTVTLLHRLGYKKMRLTDLHNGTYTEYVLDGSLSGRKRV